MEHRAGPPTGTTGTGTRGATTVHRPRRVLITGGNAGIGYEMVLALIKKGYEVVIACKDNARSAAAKARLEKEVPGSLIHLVHLDLADLSSVKECAARLSAQEPVDVMINNAGVHSSPRRLTKDGFELHFGVNFLGHYVLTSLLLPWLTSSNKPVRLINTTSAVHNISRLKFDDLMRSKSYNSWEAYGQSKLAILMWTYELARRLQGTNITVNCMHPGTVNTDLGRSFWSVALGQFVTNRVAPLLFFTPRQGAQVGIHLASSPEVEGVSGKYWAETKRPTSSSFVSRDTEAAKQLMDVAEQLTGVPPILSHAPATGTAKTAGQPATGHTITGHTAEATSKPASAPHAAHAGVTGSAPTPVAAR